ncbi:DUF3078 domain-containing protein [Gabonibacter chumensis]|uniref:DUF3078 domain-containing protein n=1 Tax=Gabonibacter chumensis TaxID=2972474 RepID=UPI0025731F51|nr:DUF3078 domain-containing protein [Gabonibacter chumensis]MCR9012049.1 DUF3078 domain-containing protein [Gabonibacter chumensis]
MVKGYVFLIFLLLIGGSSHAAEGPVRDSSWKNAGFFGLKMTQVSLSNWAAGGESALAFDAQLTYSADYKKDRNLWQNRLELGYGLTKNDGKSARKTNDKIYLASTYGYQLYKSLYWSMLLNFNTQFAKGYDYSNEDASFISKFMAPAYIVIGTGLTWTPKSYFTATLTPVSWRGTVVADSRLSDEGAFGVKEGKHLLSEFGANLRAEVTYEFWENMKIYSRLELFSDYLRKPQNVDVRWEVQLNMTVNKWISATISTNMLYDDDVKVAQKDGTAGPRLQFKEVLGVGLQFSF